MGDVMKAPLEGEVDIDPEFVQGFVDKIKDISITRFIDHIKAGGEPAPIEGELVDKGVEVTIYRDDQIPLNDFLTSTLALRRERKKEILANQNALEGEFEQGPSADMRKFYLPNGGIDVFALSAKAQRLAPKPAIEGELLPPESTPFLGSGIPMLSEACIDSGDKIVELPAVYTDANGKRTIIQPAIEGEYIEARDPNAGSHKIDDFDPHTVNDLRHALQEIETAIEGQFIGKGERHISHIVEWEFLCEPGIAAVTRRNKE